MSSSFSDAINEDFLVMDGLDLSNNFLDLSLSAESAFELNIEQDLDAVAELAPLGEADNPTKQHVNDSDDHNENNTTTDNKGDNANETTVQEPKPVEAIAQQQMTSQKRTKADRSRSPVAKRYRRVVVDEANDTSRSDDDDDDQSTNSDDQDDQIEGQRHEKQQQQQQQQQRSGSMPLPPVLETKTKKASAEEVADLERQYKQALQKLALSMRRSEMTRNQIIRYRQIQQTGCLSRPTPRPTTTTTLATNNKVSTSFSSSKPSGFLSGSPQSTLTQGLGQSRQLLQAYMDQVKPQTF